jgi:hypothetical protein
MMMVMIRAMMVMDVDCPSCTVTIRIVVELAVQRGEEAQKRLLQPRCTTAAGPVPCSVSGGVSAAAAFVVAPDGVG